MRSRGSKKYIPKASNPPEEAEEEPAAGVAALVPGNCNWFRRASKSSAATLAAGATGGGEGFAESEARPAADGTCGAGLRVAAALLPTAREHVGDEHKFLVRSTLQPS